MITDTNLKYAILSSLCGKGVFSYLDSEEFIAKERGKPYSSTAAYNYKPYPSIKKYWLEKWKEVDLGQIEEIDWNTGCDIQTDIWRYYDGEDDYFLIKSLKGIDELKNLKVLKVEFFGEINDLSPLLKLEKLERIELTESLMLSEANKKVFDELVARGVHFEIDRKTSWPDPIVRPAPLPVALSLSPEEPMPEYYPSVDTIELQVSLHDVKEWVDFWEKEAPKWMNLIMLSDQKLKLIENTESKEVTTEGPFAGVFAIYTTKKFEGENREVMIWQKMGYWNENEFSHAEFEFKFNVTVGKLYATQRGVIVTGYSQPDTSLMESVFYRSSDMPPEVMKEIVQQLKARFGSF